ncbi:TPA: thiamine/thiamine pyrophosphate ABC transporter permease ThiP [Vibrio vulnificus]|uniref:thiamine/thiamine pyrophosphate ABC transporter permease ThiP n=1 Tax=Vibrio vulnificus TaxID=672 RepID=UPI00031E2CE1|nr:thiamine/thiamine pyrophosphate ABC transporter permease ThiP [Vibrio vulnificus]ASM96036.1 thiamine ABC transporter permease [Vibrio vulnificus NBRC 15645 = ATCC 27562]AUL94419.1 thiamine/thiamine pyrophosphate ABC transporter permease ThiP [Vibrio vulnificus]EGQ7963957.1 thiamine/thiamine pyrophosphate ABC transporter permease ThiP [Vibrio vulnificus]EGQ7982517.1 thiamine/thiamine pyrophosphate ABC transporter permease ThiP [Vibrio vulnificus]EGQ8000491.1 thiamine/thiamine pyrophosphate A
MNSVPKLGIGVAMIIATFVVSALSALLLATPTLDLTAVWQDPYYRHVTQFSFLQATLSMLLSVSLALPVAHALSRRHFVGRSLLLKLFASTLVLPVLVGVFGLLAIYGNSGWLASILASFDAKLPFSIYGLSGILLAHVFFNLPYAARLLLQTLESIPAEQHKLAAHLGMNSWQKFRWVEWPRLRQQLPHVCGLVFMLCFTSFAAVMALGGGPKSTTIELAIYQAIKFDFDLQSGALLAIWQMLLCTVLVLSIQRFTKPLPVSVGSQQRLEPITPPSGLQNIWDAIWIALACLLVIPPLLMVVISGLNSKLPEVISDGRFWSAMWASFRVALGAASLAVAAAITILLTSRAWRLRAQRHRADGIEMIGTIILVTPGLVVSTGLFLLLRSFADVFSLALLIVILVNSLMALPYAIKTLAQPMLHCEQQYQYLAATLGLSGWNRFKIVEWRALRKPFANAFALCFMFSIGDLSAIALFGSQDFRTLPLYLYQLLGSYQMEAAAVVSLTLLLLSVGCFALSESLLSTKSNQHQEKSPC